MALAIISKALLTALVILSVAKIVERLGPRFGGLLAGAPVVLGPAYFFLVTEHDIKFITRAVLSSMNAMTATLVFTAVYLLVPARVSLLLTLLLSSLTWLASVTLLHISVESTSLSTMLFIMTFAAAKGASRHIPAVTKRQDKDRGFDTILRAIVAGILVGIGTGLAGYTGPILSGAIIGFPVGITAILITLHYRYGRDVTRETLSTAQTGMLSIFAFLLSLIYLSNSFPLQEAFILSILISLLVTFIFILIEFYSLLTPLKNMINNR